MIRFCHIIFIISTLLHSSTSAYASIKQQKLNYTAIHTDENNIIWIGTENGLYQWKNQDSKLITNTASMHITAIASLSNYLILGTHEGNIYCYSKSHHSLSYYGNFKAEISSIYYDQGTELGFSTKGNGYYIIGLSSYAHITTSNGLPDNFIYQLRKDKQQKWWCASDKGISVYDEILKDHQLIFKDKIPDPLVTCFAFKDDIILCGTQSGDICRLNLSDSSVQIFDRAVWNESQMNDILILDNSICIATEKGAYMLDNNGQLLQTFISNKSINHILYDLEANVWLCGNNILASYSAEQVNFITKVGEQTIAHVHSVLCDRNNQLWFTPDQGLTKYNLITKSQQTRIITPPSKLIDITSLYMDSKGTLWVGTLGGGLFLVDTQSLNVSSVAIDTTDETSSIISITADHNNLWVSGLNGVWRSKFNPKEISFTNLEDEYQKKKFYVYQVTVDHQNLIWLATDGQGMQRLESDGMEQFSTDRKLVDKVFYGASEDGNHHMWFIPYENGLYYLRNDSLIHLNIQNGLSSNDVSSIKKYDNHYMLAATSVGLDLINIHNLIVTHYAYSEIGNGILPEINSMSSDGKGKLYIGTNKGIIEFRLPTYKTEFKPKAAIEEILVMEQNVNPNTNEFSYDQNFLRFRINSIWNSPATIYYRYKLEGLNNQWNQTVDKEIVFPRLNPGKYQFILEVSNNKIFNNASATSYSFTINNPYYKQYWFIILFGISLVVSIYHFMRFREKRISRLQLLEKEKLIAEYETLKNQVNPHFLFNSLNTLMQVIDEDKEKAIEYTQTMSEFYRSVLTYRDVNLISLYEELKLLEQYIYLQKMRYGNNFIYINTCEASRLETLALPPLTLQLLAENAIKHNTISKLKPLTLKISFSKTYLIVSNNINKKHQIEPSENIGLQNIVNRYRLFTHHRVEIIHDENIFEVKLPLLKIN